MVVVAGLRLIARWWKLELLVVSPLWGVFRRDPDPYLPDFRRKLRKTLNG